MSTSITIHDPRALSRHENGMPTIEFTADKLQLLKETICKGSTNDEFELFVHACKRTGLDPFMKQIHAVKRWDAKLNREAMSIQTGIDGYRLIAERTGKYMAGQEPTYVHDASGKLVSATAYVKRWGPDGTWHTVGATAYYEEYVQTKKDGTPMAMWAKMPRGQLGKCAESLVLRKAFPADLSGVYTKEEMDQSFSESIDVTNRQQVIQQSHLPKISATQLETLDDMIGEDREFRACVMQRLLKNNIRSLQDIPADLYQRVYDACYEQHVKNELARSPAIQVPSPSVFDKE